MELCLYLCLLCHLRISHSLVPSGPFGTVPHSRWFQQGECFPSLGLDWRALLTAEPSCALNVQVFSMYSLWNHFDVSCLTLASLSWPDPAALLKGTVNRTFFLCVSCIIPLFACLPVCKCFLLQLSDSLPSKRTCIAGNNAVSVYNNLGLKQKRGFLWDSLWTTVQSVKRVERQRWREGEDGVAGESNKDRAERVSKWTN